MLKPGVTQELRTRVNAHLAAETRQRRLTAAAIVVAVLTLCGYFALRLLR